MQHIVNASMAAAPHKSLFFYKRYNISFHSWFTAKTKHNKCCYWAKVIRFQRDVVFLLFACSSQSYHGSKKSESSANNRKWKRLNGFEWLFLALYSKSKLASEQQWVFADTSALLLSGGLFFFWRWHVKFSLNLFPTVKNYFVWNARGKWIVPFHAYARNFCLFRQCCAKAEIAN